MQIFFQDIKNPLNLTKDNCMDIEIWLSPIFFSRPTLSREKLYEASKL